MRVIFFLFGLSLLASCEKEPTPYSAVYQVYSNDYDNGSYKITYKSHTGTEIIKGNISEFYFATDTIKPLFEDSELQLRFERTTTNAEFIIQIMINGSPHREEIVTPAQKEKTISFRI